MFYHIIYHFKNIKFPAPICPRNKLMVWKNGACTRNQQRTNTNSYELRLRTTRCGIVQPMKDTARVGQAVAMGAVVKGEKR
ncbi:MAG: hypothetical protein ABOK23_05845 [Candidatus Methanoperedens sp.]|nr:hypothetical protein [Candidatus Methanoperedens sp.]MCZ7396522.1 hypothetical protein [Candidatus Methanoperedens sp.]